MPHDDALQLRTLLGSLTARLPLCNLGEIAILDAVLTEMEIIRGGGDRTWMRWPSGIWHLARPLRIATDGRVTTACDGLARPAGEPHSNPPPVERCHACWRAVCGGSVIGMALLGLVEQIAIQDRDIARRREQARDEMLPSEIDAGRQLQIVTASGGPGGPYLLTPIEPTTVYLGLPGDDLSDPIEANEFAADQHATRIGGPEPYESIDVQLDDLQGEGG